MWPGNPGIIFDFCWRWGISKPKLMVPVTFSFYTTKYRGSSLWVFDAYLLETSDVINIGTGSSSNTQGWTKKSETIESRIFLPFYNNLFNLKDNHGNYKFNPLNDLRSILCSDYFCLDFIMYTQRFRVMNLYYKK